MLFPPNVPDGLVMASVGRECRVADTVTGSVRSLGSLGHVEHVALLRDAGCAACVERAAGGWAMNILLPDAFLRRRPRRVA